MKNRRLKFSRIRSFSLLVVFLIGSLPIPVQAYYEDFLMSNNILFFNPEGAECAPVTAAGKSSGRSSMDIPTLQGSENDEKIWNFLIAEGLSEEQAAGLMGNIYQEAGFDPDLEEGNGIGYGIVQWSFERRTALEDAAERQGVAVSDLGFQLAFMLDEMKNYPLMDFNGLFAKYNTSAEETMWDLLTRQDNIEDSTIVFHDGFERSGDYRTHGGIQHRIDYANKVYEKFTGRSASLGGDVAAGTECAGNTVVSGDLIELVTAYAWPTYSENNYDGPVPGPKPAYLEIATKRENEGKFVGGGTAEIGIPGIDCGGFVTTLLQESGYEPDYNSGQGAVPGQHAWAEENWEPLGVGGTFDAAELRPGDVAYKLDGQHTFLYIGQVEGFESQYASASYNWWRAPMSARAENPYEMAANPEYTWYGKR